MKFVITDELKNGMRLAKPIYNKNGVLLYDRDSKLTTPAINSIRNFGLIGIYILEPAEPLPPLSREDMEFEQLQTVYMFRLREIMDNILQKKKIETLPGLIDDILKHFGNIKDRVNFNPNLRSAEDFVYKHAISTAILMAMMTSKLHFTQQKQRTVVAAALLYGFGYRYVPKPILQKGEDLSKDEQTLVTKSLSKGIDQLYNYRDSFDFFPRAIALMQVFVYEGTPLMGKLEPDDDLKQLHKILAIANQFDRSTAMNIGHEPESEIIAMQHLQENPSRYPKDYVDCLVNCIHIVPKAASVDFTDGSKGIVLVENPADFLHPVVLHFGDNRIYDLSKAADAKKFQIQDIMKTMDNRIAIDEETLKQFVPDERLVEMTEDFRNYLRSKKEYIDI